LAIQLQSLDVVCADKERGEDVRTFFLFPKKRGETAFLFLIFSPFI
jgi:hypothetical protein